MPFGLSLYVHTVVEAQVFYGARTNIDLQRG